MNAKGRGWCERSGHGVVILALEWNIYNFPFMLETGESTLAHDKWKWEDRNVERFSSSHNKRSWIDTNPTNLTKYKLVQAEKFVNDNLEEKMEQLINPRKTTSVKEKFLQTRVLLNENSFVEQKGK